MPLSNYLLPLWLLYLLLETPIRHGVSALLDFSHILTLPGIPSLFASGKFSFVLRPHSKFTFSVEFFVLRPYWHLHSLCCLSNLHTFPYVPLSLLVLIISLHICHFHLTRSFSRPRTTSHSLSVLVSLVPQRRAYHTEQMLGKSELSECCLKVVVAEINDQLVLLNSPTGLKWRKNR